MPTEYGKLVRDRIPEIIRGEGRACGTAILSETEFMVSLREKLVEEAQEAAAADSSRLAAELADVYEVIDALAAAASIDRADILRQQARKRAERGGFDQRIRLLWVA
ncbi:MAG: nucleoside triphosphate pyrophosphohydrolase [Anaerolineae bacterium]|nr:nucleoside triphosphate pyrophosphohydrolase [Anaerolineae bacterium]